MNKSLTFFPLEGTQITSLDLNSSQNELTPRIYGSTDIESNVMLCLNFVHVHVNGIKQYCIPFIRELKCPYLTLCPSYE